MTPLVALPAFCDSGERSPFPTSYTGFLASGMSLDDREDEEFEEKDFRGIVSGAETSIFNIKKQLLTVQTLRSELTRKETIVAALNLKIDDLERDALLFSGYYHENRTLVERSYQLERSVETSKNEQYSLTKQIIALSSENESMNEEIQLLARTSSEARNKFDSQQREMTLLRKQLTATEEALHESQSENKALKLELRQAELHGLDVRNDARTRSNHLEQDLQHQKERYLTLDRKLADCEGHLKDQVILTKEWVVKHDGAAAWLSEKQLEVEHWKRVYLEQVSIFHSFSITLRSFLCYLPRY